jgi:hypothetical protein
VLNYSSRTNNDFCCISNISHRVPQKSHTWNFSSKMCYRCTEQNAQNNYSGKYVLREESGFWNLKENDKKVRTVDNLTSSSIMKIKLNKATFFIFKDTEKKIPMYDMQIIQYHEWKCNITYFAPVLINVNHFSETSLNTYCTGIAILRPWKEMPSPSCSCASPPPVNCP